MSRTNVLARTARPTRNKYRAAVADIIRTVQAEHKLTDGELAERLGVSVGTVRNARDEDSDLSAVTLFTLEQEFGAGTIDKVSELAGSRNVPVGSTCDSDALPPLAASVSSIAMARSPASHGGAVETDSECKEMLPTLRAAVRALNWMIWRGERVGEAA